jgi:hypothetical protein
MGGGEHHEAREDGAADGDDRPEDVRKSKDEAYPVDICHWTPPGRKARHMIKFA